MKKLLIDLLISFVVGCIIMILHELPKSLVYYYRNKDKNKIELKIIFKVYKYIDPVGAFLYLTTLSGFSKPYMYRIKDRKTNILLGITGFLSLLVILILSMWMLCLGYEDYSFAVKIIPNYRKWDTYFMILSYTFWYYMGKLSLATIFVNLFPVSTFDLGLVIAGRSSYHYLNMIENDYMIKFLLIITFATGMFSTFSYEILHLFARVFT